MLFQDRAEGGRVLAERLRHYAGRSDVIVLALPRGGVPVGYEVARALRAPLDVFLVRKLGVPGQEEYAMGAIASGGVRFLDEDAVRQLGISALAIERVARAEQVELERRERSYRGSQPAPKVAGRTVILVDDGLATGSTMRAAVEALRHQKPERLVIGVPVGAQESCEELKREADEVVCAATPHPFRAVGLWYRNFPQTTDGEVQELLALGAKPAVAPALPGRRS
jgi:putative phosphoribosyl transferase